MEQRKRARLSLKEIPFKLEEGHRSLNEFERMDPTLDVELTETYMTDVPYQTTWCVSMLIRTYFTLTNSAPEHIVESQARKAQKLLFKELFTPVLMELGAISRAVNAGCQVEAQKRISALEQAIINAGD